MYQKGLSTLIVSETVLEPKDTCHELKLYHTIEEQNFRAAVLCTRDAETYHSYCLRSCTRAQIQRDLSQVSGVEVPVATRLSKFG